MRRSLTILINGIHAFSLLFMLLCLSPAGSYGQNDFLKGREFWLGFMENIQTPESVIAITSDHGATGTVRIPLSGWSSIFTIPANGSIELVLPLSLTQPTGTGFFPYGVHVTTDDSVYVYAINRTGQVSAHPFFQTISA